MGLWTVNLLQRRMRGLSKLNKENHIVLIGWRGKRTIDLLTLLVSEERASVTPRDIVLCVEADVENPLPGEVSFSKVVAFTDDKKSYGCSQEKHLRFLCHGH